jgi:hypothetical protein
VQRRGRRHRPHVSPLSEAAAEDLELDRRDGATLPDAATRTRGLRLRAWAAASGTVSCVAMALVMMSGSPAEIDQMKRQLSLIN